MADVALNESPDLIRIVDPAGVTRFASEAASSLLGHRPEALVGRRVSSLDHPDDYAAMAQAQLEADLGDSCVRRLHRARHANGEYVWLETTARRVHTDDGDYTILVSRDAAGLQRLGQREALMLNRLSALVQAVDDPIVMVDAEQRVMAFSPSWGALISYRGAINGTLLGPLCRLQFPPRAVEQLESAIHRVIAGYHAEVVTMRRSAPHRPTCEVSCTPLTTPVSGPVEELVLDFRPAGRRDVLHRPRSRPDACIAPLTQRERQVLLGMGEGLSVQELGADLEIEESTVRGYIKSLLHKLNAHSQLQAVLVGIRSGIIPMDGQVVGYDDDGERASPDSVIDLC